MRRVVLDTNVLVSGLLTDHGHSARILDAWRGGRFVLVTSEEIIDDVKEVVNDPELRANSPRFTRARIGRLINLLHQASIVVPGAA